MRRAILDVLGTGELPYEMFEASALTEVEAKEQHYRANADRQAQQAKRKVGWR